MGKACLAIVLTGAALGAGLRTSTVGPTQSGPVYDVVILGGEIIDGTGGQPFVADVAIADGKIARVGNLGNHHATRIIRAAGLYVVPGFIDLHSHAERGLAVPELAPALNNLKQGITTVVVGADGAGAWPLHETIHDQVERLTHQGIGINAALMVGQGQVRRQVMGLEERAPTAADLAQMKRLVRDAMQGGAVGLSSGLAYIPGGYAKTEEVVELAREVAPFGGIYHSHLRDEQDRLTEAVREAIQIAEESRVTGIVSHFRAMYRRNWGRVREAAGYIEQARARGVRIFADQFPFTTAGLPPGTGLIPKSTWWGTERFLDERAARLSHMLASLPQESLVGLYAEIRSLSSLEPQELQFLRAQPRERLLNELISIPQRAGPGRAWQVDLSGLIPSGPANPEERRRFLSRLADPLEGAKIRGDVEQNIASQGGADKILVLPNNDPEPRTLQQIAQALGKGTGEAAIKLELEGARVAAIEAMSEEDVEYLMRKEYVATSTDGTLPYWRVGTDHPRSYATYPTKIRKYALSRGTITLPNAIRSSTELPAAILGWTDRGVLKEGGWADIVVFNPRTIQPRSTFANVHQYSEGIDFVLVNGKLAVDEGRPTGALAGRILTLYGPPGLRRGTLEAKSPGGAAR